MGLGKINQTRGNLAGELHDAFKGDGFLRLRNDPLQFSIPPALLSRELRFLSEGNLPIGVGAAPLEDQ